MFGLLLLTIYCAVDGIEGSISTSGLCRTSHQTINVTWLPVDNSTNASSATINNSSSYYKINWQATNQTNTNERTVSANVTSFIINELEPATQYEVTVMVRLNTTQSGARNSSEVIFRCQLKTKDGVASPPNNVSVRATSPESAEISWTPPEKAKGIIRFYSIQYAFRNSTDVTQLRVRSRRRSFVVDGLLSHSVYQFRVSALNQIEGEFSPWIYVNLDVKTFLVKTEIPVNKKIQFQRALPHILPMSYTGSSEVNSTRLHLGRDWAQVFYHLYFDIGVSITHSDISVIMRRNRARQLLNYARTLVIYDVKFCGTSFDQCHPSATCHEMIGRYSCSCMSDFIDTGVSDHRLPGHQCEPNTDQPLDMIVDVVNPTTVIVEFGEPDSNFGNIIKYQLEWQTISGVVQPARTVDIHQVDFFIEYTLHNLPRYQMHRFRARAITNQARGRWSPWVQARTVSSLYMLIFDLNLNRTVHNYQAIQNDVHTNVTTYVKDVLSSTAQLVTDVEVDTSDITGQGQIRFQVILNLQPLESEETAPAALQSEIKLLFYTRLSELMPLGTVNYESIQVTDMDECRNQLADCRGNPCSNTIGTFECSCPFRTVDVSSDYLLLPGRRCLAFDEPQSFRAALRDPRTALLTWTIPPMMRQRELRFFFMVQSQRISDPGSNATTRFPIEDGVPFYENNFAMSVRMTDLLSNSAYEFRVAAANTAAVGKYTAWVSLETSYLIFVLKLNLTRVLYVTDFENLNHAATMRVTESVKNLVSRVMGNKIQQYISTGNITLTPGILDRTYAIAHLLFKPRSPVVPNQIEQAFRHNAIFEMSLGVDFDAVEIKDFDECATGFDDCSPHAICTNVESGFNCECNAEYEDWSNRRNFPPGRTCVNEDMMTTPAPSSNPSTQIDNFTTPTEPPTTTVPLPNVYIDGVAVTPTKLKLTWSRTSPSQSGRRTSDLDYVFQYKVKGFTRWERRTVASTVSSLIISGLRANVLYLVRVAEKWKDSSDAHTSFGPPIEIRMSVKSFRIFLRFPTLSSDNLNTNHLKSQLKASISNFLSDTFTSTPVLTAFPSLKFGRSSQDVTFAAIPDTGIISSTIFYLASSSTASLEDLRNAYFEGSVNAGRQYPTVFMSIEDVNECAKSKLNDCSPTASCTNTIGWYSCACRADSVDGSHTYNLLPGRHCVVVATPPPTAATQPNSPLIPVLSDTSLPVVNGRPLNSTLVPIATQTISTTVATTAELPHTPVNWIGLADVACRRGQLKIDGTCQDVYVFLGTLDAMQTSGVNVTAANLVGPGRTFVSRFIKAALDQVFGQLNEVTSFSKTQIQHLEALPSVGARVTFVIISEKLTSDDVTRFRRQTFFSMQMTARAIQRGLTRTLLASDGLVSPIRGTPVRFKVDTVRVSDVNECSQPGRLSDCDVIRGICENTEGSFRCRCKPFMRDTSANHRLRSGRKCDRQCEPMNPCRNEGICSNQAAVGPPQCQCLDGFSGPFCEEKDSPKSDNRLMMAALLAVAGAIFIFATCVGVCFCAKRRRKKRQKEKRAERDSSSYDESDNSDSSDDDVSCNDVKPPILERAPVKSSADNNGVTPTLNGGNTETIYVNRNAVEPISKPLPVIDDVEGELPPSPPPRTASMKPNTENDNAPPAPLPRSPTKPPSKPKSKTKTVTSQPSRSSRIARLQPNKISGRKFDVQGPDVPP